MDPALQELTRADLDPDQTVEAIIRLSDKHKAPSDFKVITQLGHIVTGRLKRGDILKVYRSPLVKSMKASRYVTREPWSTRMASNPGPVGPVPGRSKSSRFSQVNGKGVVVGVIDWGIDFAHPNFRNPDGTTRLLALWDQTHQGSDPLKPYGYGKLYHRQSINKSLRSDRPYASLGYHPAKGSPGNRSAHGTHVADIAAGNGKKGPPGLATHADLVFVHLSAKGSPLSNLGDSVRILEAVDFISRTAGSRPCAINLSVGRHGGHHRGTSLVEQGMDAFLEGSYNRAICQSTGNYYLAQAHTSGVVRPGRVKNFTFHVDQADLTQNELEVWYQANDRFIFQLKQEQMPGIFRCAPDGNTDITINQKVVGRIYHRTGEPNTGLNNINVFLYPEAPPGNWTSSLYGTRIIDGRYHAWIERDGSCSTCQSRFLRRYVDPAYTTGTICNGFNTIAVGAIETGSLGFRIAPFSSKGPTTDGRVKPDLVAPGVKILAARSTPGYLEKNPVLLTRMSGTSMAAPHVTGTMALMMQAINKPVHVHTLRNIVLGSTDNIKVSSKDRMRVGSGILNVNKALTNAYRYNRTHRKKRNVRWNNTYYKTLIDPNLKRYGKQLYRYPVNRGIDTRHRNY